MELKITENLYNIDIKNLIKVGNRINNNKRNFLFISKVLGKHIEVKPDICKAIGFLLTSTLYGENEWTSILVKYIEDSEKYKNEVRDIIRLPYETSERICVLGFAETATGLGMAVASSINDSYYLTTTREDIKDIKSLLKFEEEHSHATTHKCYPETIDNIMNADRIILVDDEITTGKSMINIIKELSKKTNVKDYTVLTILDWRNEEYREEFKSFTLENNINVTVNALISGDINVTDNTVFYDNEDEEITEKTNVIELNTLSKRNEYLKYTGRFGVNYKDIVKTEEECENSAKEIAKIIGDYNKILVLGHGENIYIPSRIASYLKGDVSFKSTTRSPIYCKNSNDYPIREKNIFMNNGVKYYFYNKSKIEKEYDKVVLITEDNLNIKLTNNIIIVKP